MGFYAVGSFRQHMSFPTEYIGTLPEKTRRSADGLVMRVQVRLVASYSEGVGCL